MSTSNSADPVSAGTEVVAASTTESSAQHDTTQTSSEPAYEAKSPKDLEGLKEIAKHSTTSPALANPVASGAPGTENPKPIFQPNWKYKAFGKEKEIDEMWRPLVKDPDSEQKVKDIFTKVDAFDELKNKHESTSKEFQGLLGEYQALIFLLIVLSNAHHIIKLFDAGQAVL